MDAYQQAEQALAAGTLLRLRSSDLRAGDVLVNDPEALPGVVRLSHAWLLRTGHSEYEVAVLVEGELRRFPDTPTERWLVIRSGESAD